MSRYLSPFFHLVDHCVGEYRLLRVTAGWVSEAGVVPQFYHLVNFSVWVSIGCYKCRVIKGALGRDSTINSKKGGFLTAKP